MNADECACGDIQPGFDDALVAEADADARFRAEQTTLADADLLGAAARQRAHDAGTTADVAAVADDDTLRDATFNHRGAKRARVEVAEPLVHDGGARGEVCPEAHTIGVGDAHSARDDIVGHARKLVDTMNAQDAAIVADSPAEFFQPVDRRRAEVRPHDVGELAEDAIEVDRPRPHQPMRQHMQPQVRVARRTGSNIGIDMNLHSPNRDVPDVVLAFRGRVRLELLRVRFLAQPDFAEPCVEHSAVASNRRQAATPCARH